MALRNYNTREENEMQDLTQKQIDLAGFSEKGFSQEQINQIYEYAQMVGDELKVRNLIWSIGGQMTNQIRNELYSLWMMPERKWRFIRIPK